MRVRKVAINTEIKTNLFSQLGGYVEKANINQEIQILEWVLSDTHEPQTIQLETNGTKEIN